MALNTLKINSTSTSLRSIIQKQIDFYKELIKYQKVDHKLDQKTDPKRNHLSLRTKYSLINKWEENGLVTVQKKGRSLEVKPTRRGLEVFKSLSSFNSLDFF